MRIDFSSCMSTAAYPKSQHQSVELSGHTFCSRFQRYEYSPNNPNQLLALQFSAICFILFRIIFVGIAFIVGTLVHAESPALPGMVLITTAEGCQVYVTEKTGQSPVPSVKLTFQWEGKCVGGLAQGRGILTRKMQGSRVESETKMYQIRNAGFALGYGKWITKTSNTPTQDQPDYVFSYGNREVQFNSMGLNIDESLLASNQISLPNDGKVNMKVMGEIQTLNASYAQFSVTCAVFSEKVPQFKDCSFGVSDKDFEVPTLIVMPLDGDRATRIARQQEYFCPDPKIFDAACVDKFYEKTSTARKEVIDFIATSKSSVENILRRIEQEK